VRALAVLVLLLVAVAVLGQLSGREPERDAVAAAERALGIDLETGRVDAGEVELFVVQAGPPAGPPVVLLHGFPEFWYAWSQQIGPLAAAGFRVIVPDQRGYAGSDKPSGVAAYDVAKLAGDAAGLIEALGHSSACVAAHDWGGGVAWQLAILHPQRVRRLVVFDTPHPDAGRGYRSEEESVSWYRTAFQIPLLPEWLSRLAHWRLLARMLVRTSAPGAFPEEKLDLYRSAWDHDGAYGSMVNWYRAAFRRPDYTGPERRIAQPTLVAVAADDAFIPADLTRRSAALLDDGRLVELGYGTHWVLQEEPQRTAALVAEFCGAGATALAADPRASGASPR
jgi:pimeloyl-ACP methyl ester carboxylesterase